MAGCKGFYIRQTIGNLTTDRVVIFKAGIRRFPFLYLFHDLTESVQRFRCLGKEADITSEIQTIQVFRLLDHDGGPFRLSDQTVHFCMSFFTVYHQLCMMFTRFLIAFMYPLL